METRRYILAIALSMLVLMTYMHFFGPKPVAPPTTAEQTAPAAKKQEARQPLPQAVAARLAPAKSGRDIVIETDLLKAVVNTAGGVITKWELKQYREANKEQVGMAVLWKKITGRAAPKELRKEQQLGNVELLSAFPGVDRKDVTLPLTVTPIEASLGALRQVEYRASADAVRLNGNNPSQTLVLTYAGPGGISVRKSLTFRNEAYTVDVAVATTGLDGYSLALGTDFGVSDKISSDSEGRVGFAALVDGKTVTERIDKIGGESNFSGDIAWFGLQDKYFTAALLSGGPAIVTARRAAGPKELGDLMTAELQVKDKPEARTFTLYAGPKNFNILQSYGKGLERLVDYGWFGILAKPMFWLMTFFFSLTKNYGIAIILLTIVVRVLLFYPSLKSATAMEEMKAIQPQLTAIREKYKKDPQKMNQEMMRLYKEHKVNPVGGCLPMLLQLPFFVALYNVLSVSIELRQASFLSFWIKDLSVYDPFYILPVLMGVSMIFTMKMTSTSIDPQQQKIMMFMNVAFIFLFAWLPAGLLLYITLSNVLSIVQQLYVRRIIAAAK